jgi:hypothetical protein
MGQPDAPTKLAEFQNTSAWRQQEFVEKGGWATLPGGKEPNTNIVGACAELLTQPHKPSTTFPTPGHPARRSRPRDHERLAPRFLGTDCH